MKALFLSIIFIIQHMNFSQPGYKVLTSRECLQYVEQHNVKEEDFNLDYTIPSRKGLVYTMPNGEFVLVPTHIDPLYPGFIFKDKNVFKEHIQKDFFPIGKEHMTFLEAHSSEAKQILVDATPFLNILSKSIGVDSLFNNQKDLEEGYNKLYSFVHKKKNQNPGIKEIIESFGICAIEYFHKHNGYELQFDKQYEIYNPYFLPILIRDDRRINAITMLYIALESKSPDSFKQFIISIEKI
jgi:hypothetical protein